MEKKIGFARDGNNISIGFSLNKVLEIEDKSSLLGKIMQNIKICNKYNVNYYIVNFINNKDEELNKDDIRSLGLTLGMLPGKINIIQKVVK